MSRKSELTSKVPATVSDRPIKRALFLASALAVLWLVVRLFSPPSETPKSPVETPSADVAIRNDLTPAQLTRKEDPALGAGSLAALALLAAGGGLAVYLKKKKGPLTGTRRPIEDLGRLQLSPNTQLQLVGCGEDILLLGVTAGQITVLKNYPKTSLAIEPGPTHSRPISTPVPQLSEPFAQFLRKSAFKAAAGRIQE